MVPSYRQTSNSSTSGVLTMVPVASVEGHVNPKIFIVYKSSSGLSHMYTDRLSAHFGFCSYDWVEYPCSGLDA